jgi:hypothetical protein
MKYKNYTLNKIMDTKPANAQTKNNIGWESNIMDIVILVITIILGIITIVIMVILGRTGAHVEGIHENLTRLNDTLTASYELQKSILAKNNNVS